MNADTLVLRAGSLRMLFNPAEGSARYILAGDHEVLRGIGAPVRDASWATISPRISDLVTRQTDDAFEITFEARCRADEIDFRWKGTLRGSADHVFTFEFDGEALAGFKRNRIGICVLHPAELRGRPCAVTHGDGTREDGAFPDTIRVGAPFTNIRAIRHRIAPGLEAEVLLEGDAFEMEDQRNWTDASFKTYCTPLSLPRPVQVNKGDRVRQKATVRLHGAAARQTSGFTPPWRAPDEVTIEIGARAGRALPARGVIWNVSSFSGQLLEAMRPLRLDHLRVDLEPGGRERAAVLRSASIAAAELGAGLELALCLGDPVEDQLARTRDELAALDPAPRIDRWLVFHEADYSTPPAVIEAARAAFVGTPWAAPVGGGSTENFTELNLRPAGASAADFTVHACNPQVHAFDEASIVETLAMQGLTAAGARRLSGGRPVVVSPVTFTRRWRVGETGAPPRMSPCFPPFQTDPRLASPFAAAWMLGSLAALAREGVASATWFEAVGDNGLFSEDGALRPVGAVFASVADFARAEVVDARSSHPLCASALALESKGRRLLVLASHRDTAQPARIRGAWGERILQLAGHGAQSLAFP